MKGGRRRIDRILDESYAEGLSERPLDELRKMRAECEEEEEIISYERRLLHGKVDIMRAELERRREGGGSLLDQLARILADDTRSSRGAFPREIKAHELDRSRRRVERLVSDDTLAKLPSLPDDELEKLAGIVSEVAEELSKTRHEVHEVLDSIKAEIVRRYRVEPPDPSEVLARR